MSQSSNQPVNHTRGFITVANKRYRKPVELLARSVEMFSRYPLEVFCLDWLPKDLPGLANAKPLTADVSHPHYAKYAAALRTPFDSTVFLDADGIVNHTIDDVFKYEAELEDYPLLVKHPHTKDLDESLKSNGGSLRNYLGVDEQLTPYMQSCLFLFDRRCASFFQDMQRMLVELEEQYIRPVSYDENVFNGYVWKRGGDRYIKEVCISICHWDGLGDVKTWFERSFLPQREASFYLHGNKDPFELQQVLDIVRATADGDAPNSIDRILTRRKPWFVKAGDALTGFCRG